MNAVGTIRVPGAPVVTPRPRVMKGYTYIPKKAKQAQQNIAIEWKKLHLKPLSGAVMIDVRFKFAPPKSWPKWKKTAAIERRIYPTSHAVGDIDNLLKTCQDGLNGIAYVDDAQIVRAVVRADYAPEAETIITIYDLEEDG